MAMKEKAVGHSFFGRRFIMENNDFIYKWHYDNGI